MKAIIAAKDDLLLLASRLDLDLGYPKPGVNVGDGIHAPPEQSVTLRHVELRKHPAREEWAYPVDVVTESMAASAKQPRIGAAVELAEDWFRRTIT